MPKPGIAGPKIDSDAKFRSTVLGEFIISLVEFNLNLYSTQNRIHNAGKPGQHIAPFDICAENGAQLAFGVPPSQYHSDLKQKNLRADMDVHWGFSCCLLLET